MIITRKIQVFVSEQDSELKKNFIHTLYEWRDLVRKAANIIVSHKFVQDNVKDFVYIKDEIKEKFYVKDVIKKGKGMSEQNTTYRVLSDLLKGKVPADIYSCLNQAISNTYKKARKDIYIGKASLRNYKNNIPIPFSANALSLKWNKDDERFYFTLFGIPFVVALGRDMSNNRVIIERCISGEYKLCSSSIAIDDKKKKTFLYLCVDVPQKEVKLKEGKTLYAFLGVLNPIVCTTETYNPFSEDGKGMKVWEIGTAEEFNYRRRQINELCRRVQKDSKYNVGGKGRKRKLQALERFEEKEKNYVETKLHTYSRHLVDLAVKHECDTIYLTKQPERENKAKEDRDKGEDFVLRNWSYYGLKQKIEYKAEMYGIKLKQDRIE